LTAALPLMLALTGIAPSSPPAVAAATASPLELLELIAAAVAVSLLLRLMKFPASWMFGAMIASSLLHGIGYVEGGLPSVVRVVGAHHLCRFVFVTIATPGIVHLFGRPQEDVDD